MPANASRAPFTHRKTPLLDARSQQDWDRLRGHDGRGHMKRHSRESGNPDSRTQGNFRLPPRLSSSESGVVLITTLLLMVLLLFISASGLALSRTDIMIARNLLSGVQTLWIARAGTEVGKNWLEQHRVPSMLPIIIGPASFASGTYSVEVAALGNGSYRLTSTGHGPEGSRRVIEEVVRVPDFVPTGVVTNDGDGLHPDFDDLSGGAGRRIPGFSIDARNHAPDGSLSPDCPASILFATTQATAQTDLLTATATLKREIVTRANAFCLASGGSTAGGICTPGLSWVRGTAALPRFRTDPCVGTDSTCFVNLDLAQAALRATALPPTSYLPVVPQNRGPMTPAPTTTAPLVKLLTTSEQTRLRTALDEITQRIAVLPNESTLHITTSITSGAHAYGTPDMPKVTLVEDGTGALEISGGATVNGVGILVVPRVVQLKNATLNWLGIILIVGDGDLRVEHAAACGQITGAVVIRDDATLDRKFDLDLVGATALCSPFAVNYSCEATTRALALLAQTVSWTEKFDG
jgi:hypothetical protein